MAQSVWATIGYNIGYIYIIRYNKLQYTCISFATIGYNIHINLDNCFVISFVTFIAVRVASMQLVHRARTMRHAI